MGVFGKGKPDLPMYEELADTPWITRNRSLNDKTWKNLNRDWNSVNVMDDEIRQQLNAYNDSIYNRAKSDFDRDYSQTMNKYLARDYNRLGTTGGTSSLLTRDNYNLAKQRELADLDYNKAINYENMIDKELQRRYNWLNQNYGAWVNSGQTTEAHDVANWEIRNKNKDRSYMNDVQGYNNSFGNKALSLLPAALGAVGSMWGPVGAMAGTALGNLAYGGDATNLLRGDVGTSNMNPYSAGDWMNAYGYAGAKSGNKYWGSLEEQAQKFGNNSLNNNSYLGQVLKDLSSNTTGSLNNNLNNSLNNSASNRMNYWTSSYPLMSMRNNIGDFYNALVGLG